MYSRGASRSAQVSSRILPGISTYSSCSDLRLTRRGIGADEFDIDVGGGGGVAAGAGAGRAAMSAGDDVVTGTDFGTGT